MTVGTHKPQDWLYQVLQHPTTMAALTGEQWDVVLRLARASDVTARLAYLAHSHGVLPDLPESPARYLRSALAMLERQHLELSYEIEEIALALRNVGVPVVLLKGAAYAAAGSLAAKGRFVSDVDVLVPQASLPQIESALMMAGWVTHTKSAYDERYYRTWMHELPPMQHIKRGTVIDVHHAIMPLSARVHPSSELLLQGAIKLYDDACLHVLQPVDMLLHSATHWAHEGEFDQGLRGLVDLDALLTEFGRNESFWQQLVPRAQALELQRPLFYALRYAPQVLGTQIPQSVQDALALVPGAKPSAWQLKFMDRMFARVLAPNHHLVGDRWTPLARQWAYLRGHWLRMPPHLLLLHLTRKLFATSSKEA